jgi:hypothetical protein
MAFRSKKVLLQAIYSTAVGSILLAPLGYAAGLGYFAFLTTIIILCYAKCFGRFRFSLSELNGKEFLAVWILTALLLLPAITGAMFLYIFGYKWLIG